MRPILTTLLLAVTATAAEPGQRYAVLVGVKDYEHSKLPPLRYTENDAAELAAILKTHGYQVTLLTDSAGEKDADLRPTRANILKQLEAVLDKCKRHDTVLVGLAGHGLQFADQPDSYFCPIDAKPFAEDADTLVSLQDLYARLDRCGAGVKLMLVDACRDDPNRPRGAARGIDGDSAPIPKGRGIGVLFSCSASERAFEHDDLKHGVFFHFVIQGLKGEAENFEGAVTWDSLRAYVKRQVTRQVPELIGGGARQRPNEVGNILGEPPVLIVSLEDDIRAVTEDILAGKGSVGFIERVGPKKADRWRLAALNGSPAGQLLYAQWVEFGPGGPEDPEAAIPWYRRSAEQGFPLGQVILGSCYEHGFGVEADPDEAVKWYRKAAEQGYWYGQSALGNCYASGVGVEKDADQALRLLQKAADQGHLPSVMSIGQVHYAAAFEKDDPDELKAGLAEAAKWFRKAAEGGYDEAQFVLAELHRDGAGVERDYAAAARWYGKAAEQGHADSQLRYGLCYFYGQGTDADPAEAVKWLRKASEKGHPYGHRYLGLCYGAGLGVEKDVEEAKRLLRKAADAGDKEAEALIKEIQ